MEQSKKKTLIISILGVFIVIVALLGVTYAFFNYTRTGPANTVKTGRIYFTHEQGNTINMENAFPISSTAAQTDTTNAKTVQIIVTGDTDYSGGEEYLITASDVHMETTTGKTVPITLDVSVAGRNSKTLGTVETGDYYANRESYTTSKYKIEYNNKLGEESHLLVGYIAPNTTLGTAEGIDGIVSIKAYFNEEDILITDTLENGSIEEVGYDNGTQNNGKIVLTTSEWNSLKGNNALSFSVKVESREGIWVENPNIAYRIIKKNAITPTNPINFANVSSSSNGEGLYILPGTENNNNPIYYYRGDVTDNNVVFGGYCWKMVRTTDTGGIKMVYNGVVIGTSEEPTCENTSSSTSTSNRISSSTFNSNSDSTSDVGYMSNARYPVVSDAPTNGAYFGTSVEYGKYDTNNPGTNVYRLVDDGNGSVGTTLDENHHYTCNKTTANETCTTIRYYYNKFSPFYYYIDLTNGELVEDAIYKMTGNIVNPNVDVVTRNTGYVLNQNDSKAKEAIESWFRTNLTNEVDNTKRNYQLYLEDTLFCNDRSFKTNSYNQSGWNPNGGSLTTNLFFGTMNRVDNNWYSTTNVPSMTCPNETDRFSVSSSVAHLNYPVGLLTADEIVMAGALGSSNTNQISYYLHGGSYWSLSPSHIPGRSNAFIVYYSGSLNSDYSVTSYRDLHPVVSLKFGTEFESGGNGTPTKPYVVKY